MTQPFPEPSRKFDPRIAFGASIALMLLAAVVIRVFGAKFLPKEKSVAIDWAPASVQAAVNNMLPGQTLQSLGREEIDARPYFRATFTAKGSLHSVMVAENGDILQPNQDPRLVELPAMDAAPIALATKQDMVAKR